MLTASAESSNSNIAATSSESSATVSVAATKSCSREKYLQQWRRYTAISGIPNQCGRTCSFISTSGFETSRIFLAFHLG